MERQVRRRLRQRGTFGSLANQRKHFQLRRERFISYSSQFSFPADLAIASKLTRCLEMGPANHRAGVLKSLEEMRMAQVAKIEKFTLRELAALKGKLMTLRTDSWQAAELVSDFLADRGYGVNFDAMRTAVPELAVLRSSHDSMQSMLETVAYVM